MIGTIRRECLDWLIPLSEAHLRLVLKTWIGYYNRARVHMSLGPGVPGLSAGGLFLLSVAGNYVQLYARCDESRSE